MKIYVIPCRFGTWMVHENGDVFVLYLSLNTERIYSFC